MPYRKPASWSVSINLMFIDILSFMRSWLCYIQVPMSIFDHHGASPPDTLHSVSDVAQAQRASALYQPQHQLGVAAIGTDCVTQRIHPRPLPIPARPFLHHYGPVLRCERDRREAFHRSEQSEYGRYFMVFPALRPTMSRTARDPSPSDCSVLDTSDSRRCGLA